MKQEDKSKASYDKILKAAVEEFGTKSYSMASINNLCSKNNISKGLIYHYFKNKDEMYLKCVERCFKQMIDYISKTQCNKKTVYENVKKLLDMRYKFFRENPCYSNIFFYVVIDPPKHLIEQIKTLRTDLDEFHRKHYMEIVSQLKLRDGISADTAVEYFFLFQESFNGYFQSKYSENLDFNLLIKDHEMKLSEILNIMLYGIAMEEN